MRTLGTTDYLDMAYLYATKLSGCNKVHVGCVLVDEEGHMISFGANRAIPDLCRYRGCLRVEKYGDDSKSHRNPEDCRAIHSEIDALANLRQSASGTTAYVTRYPCEGCAKALVAAGVKRVCYGGTATVSDQTKEMLEGAGVECRHIPDWKEDLSDR